MYSWPLPALVRKYRWLASEHGPDHPAAQAARGRLNATMRRVPALTGPDAKSPAAIAAHRALGRDGYLNRSWRHHVSATAEGLCSLSG